MLIHQRGPNKVCESPPLPPGFRFHPTDEELVSCYLTHKVLDSNVVFQAIGEVDFNKCEPWDLPAIAKVGHQNIFYFFSLRDRKYPTGLRTNRATEAGYWKATGRDREVIAKSSGRMLGMKKTLVFYKGRAPKGEKTNWIMHEYRLESEFKPDQREWVVCRAFEKNVSSKRTPPESYNAGCNGEYSRGIPCSFEPALPDLKSFDAGYNGEYSTDLPCPFEPDLPDLKSFNAGYDGEYSTDLLCPFEPALPDLKSFSSNSLKSNAPFEPQGWFQDAIFSGQEKILRRSDSSMKAKRVLGDTLENLVSGWDMGSPVPIWDLSVEHQLIP